MTLEIQTNSRTIKVQSLCIKNDLSMSRVRVFSTNTKTAEVKDLGVFNFPSLAAFLAQLRLICRETVFDDLREQLRVLQEELGRQQERYQEVVDDVELMRYNPITQHREFPRNERRDMPIPNHQLWRNAPIRGASAVGRAPPRQRFNNDE